MNLTSLVVEFNKKGDPPLWGDIPRERVTEGQLAHAAILDEGTEAGNPSVMFRIGMPDGTYVVAQQTGKQIATLGRMLLIKYPHLLD